MAGFIKCSACNGSGLTLADYTGEPRPCYNCQGDGVERERDTKGRFVKIETPKPSALEIATGEA